MLVSQLIVLRVNVRTWGAVGVIDFQIYTQCQVFSIIYVPFDKRDFSTI